MEILNKQQLADYLKVEIKTVNCLLYKKKIPKIKIGREYRFIKSDIDEWLLSNREKAKETYINLGNLHR